MPISMDQATWPVYLFVRAGTSVPDQIPIEKARTDEEAWELVRKGDWNTSAAKIFRISYEEVPRPK